MFKQKFSKLKEILKKKKKVYFYVLLLLTIVLTILLWTRVVISIHPGKAGVLYNRFTGTEIDYIYEEGLHLISPLNLMSIYEIRKQIALHEFYILSVKGLKVQLSLAIRYRPKQELLGILHQQIGPDYLTRVIIPQIESVMRKELGNYKAEDIYTNKEGLLTNAILLSLDEVGRNYVEVEDIIIRSLNLPPRVKNAIDDKLIHEQKLLAYEFRLKRAEKEAERLEVEAKGIKVAQKHINETLSDNILLFKGIKATKELAKSNNAKIVVIGSGDKGLPIILNAEK